MLHLSQFLCQVGLGADQLAPVLSELTYDTHQALTLLRLQTSWWFVTHSTDLKCHLVHKTAHTAARDIDQAHKY